MTEQVNSPPHYTSGGLEVIDVIKAKLTPEEYKGYLRGNCLKYLLRADYKGGRVDIEKMIWYASRLRDQCYPTQGQGQDLDDAVKVLKHLVKDRQAVLKKGSAGDRDDYPLDDL